MKPPLSVSRLAGHSTGTAPRGFRLVGLIAAGWLLAFGVGTLLLVLLLAWPDGDSMTKEMFRDLLPLASAVAGVSLVCSGLLFGWLYFLPQYRGKETTAAED